MIKIQLPERLQVVEDSIDRSKLKAIFEKGGKYPAIKEQLVLKAHEITTTTKVIYESDLLTVLIGEDETGNYLSCFNKGKEDIQLEVFLSALGLSDKQNAYCVLTAEDLAVIDKKLILIIPDEGLLLVKLTEQES